jgi:chemotaxis signal transduction protein
MTPSRSPKDRDQEVLRARARQLAAPKSSPPLIDLTSWAIAVSVGSQRFLFPLCDVSATSRLAGVGRVPFAPEYVLGIVQDSGELVTVIDLARVLRAPGSQDPQYRLTVERGGRICAFAVEAVEGFVRVEEADVRPAPSHLPSDLRGVVRGTTSQGEFLLESDALLRAVGISDATTGGKR